MKIYWWENKELTEKSHSKSSVFSSSSQCQNCQELSAEIISLREKVKKYQLQSEKLNNIIDQGLAKYE